jgi:anti-sigma regulatory factor (Ser/Thr protein kinase)/cell division protein FtsL
LCRNAPAQNNTFTYYTIASGLPSNNLYETLVDKKGFLWMATDNGLCRFDGSEIKVYTTAHGLPDNDVPDIDMDSTGTVWALPFQKYPVYYNSAKDRFENEHLAALKQQIPAGVTKTIGVLRGQGVYLISSGRTVFLMRPNQLRPLVMPGPDTKYAGFKSVWETGKDSFLVESAHFLTLLAAGKTLAEIPLGQRIFNTGSLYLNNIFYLPIGNTLHRYSVTPNARIVELPVQTYIFRIRYFGYTGRQLYLVSESGLAYGIDRDSMGISSNLYSRGANVKSILEDNDGNTWLSTRDEGLVRIQPQKAATLDDALPGMLQNFNAVCVSGSKIYAGNNKGEIFIYQPPFSLKKINLSQGVGFDFWVRKIISLPGSVFVANQNGDFWLDKNSGAVMQQHTVSNGQVIRSAKAALRVNDSVLLLGNHGMATRWNMNSQMVTDSIKVRVTALGTTAGRNYIGSTNGLFEWAGSQLVPLSTASGAFNYRVATLFGTADSLLWVGLGADSLLVIRNNHLISSIAIGKDIPGTACKALYSNRPGEIWLGTDKGVTRIRYQYAAGQLQYTSAWFGAADGLVNENINDITIAGDTVYMATAGGISYMPAGQPQFVSEIPVIITNVYAAGTSRGAVQQLSLPFNEANVRIEYSGIDLSGYTPRFTYRVNNGAWQYSSQHFIEVQFAPGSNTIEIAAIKRNGQRSAKTARVNIYIKVPFWRTTIFWLGLIMLLSAAGFYLLVRRNRRKRLQQQEKALAERKLMELEMNRMAAEQQVAEEKLIAEKKLAQLEMQALRAQVNPHFVFNCLNSIKGFIHEKDYAQADRYLDAFSVLLRNTLETSVVSTITLREELEYLDNYIQLEQLRFNNQFACTLTAEGVADPGRFMIPSMLIQPYVENAIRHGMRHLKNKQGHIGVTFSVTGLSIQCTVDDNGVGRAAAAAFKSGLHIEYQGRGMQISNRRAQLYNAVVEVIDKTNSDGTAAGTTVILTIPVQEK